MSKRSIFLNGLPAFIADSIDNINEISSTYKISKKNFLAYNDVEKNHKIIPGMPYYLSKKRRKGRVQLYLRREDESLWEISQLFGVQLSSLKKINKENNTSKILMRRRSIL